MDYLEQRRKLRQMGSFFIVFCALHPISNLLRASGIFPLASFFLRSSVWRKAFA